MIIVQLENLATETFDHCKCPNCLRSNNVYTVLLSEVANYEIERIEDDVLCCVNTDCHHLFDWVTGKILAETDEIDIKQD